MTEQKQNITDLTLTELQQAMSLLGEPAFRATQIHQWLFSHHAASFEEMTILSLALRKKLSESFSIHPLKRVEHQECFEEDCESPTEKILLELQDKSRVESVLIATENRRTACV
ncbi:MAG: 23S rRNA (adenine(2503)-C(2))-methyltransferase RlmN, partial [Pelodictyon phaeoclathratiforme]